MKFSSDDLTERIVPWTLIAVGALVFVIAGFTAAGTDGARIFFVSAGRDVLLRLGLLLPLLFLAAAMLDIDFGYLGSAILKFAGILVFTSSIWILIPSVPIAWMVSTVLYIALIAWLFVLDLRDTLLTVVIIWVGSVALRIVIDFLIGPEG